jgi:hypothetical protein
LELDSVKRILSGFFNNGIDTAGPPAYAALQAFASVALRHRALPSPPAQSVIAFTPARTSAVLIPMGLRFEPRFIAQCNCMVTESAKALKSLAPQMKNRFTSSANFLSELSFGNGYSRPAPQGFGLASSPAHAAMLSPPKGGSRFSRRNRIRPQGSLRTLPAANYTPRRFSRRIASRFVSHDFGIMKCPVRSPIDSR